MHLKLDINAAGNTLNEDRDILATVHRVAAHALSGQAARNEGMLKLADSMGRIRERWDLLESANQRNEARVAELEDLLDVTRLTSAAKVAKAEEELAEAQAEIARLRAEGVAALAAARAEREAAEAELQARADATLAEAEERHRAELEDVRRAAEKEIDDVKAVAKASIDGVEQESARLEAGLRNEVASLRTRIEEVMTENESLVRGISILITQTQNTTRAMQEEDQVLTNAVGELLSFMGMQDETPRTERSDAAPAYLEAPASGD